MYIHSVFFCLFICDMQDESFVKRSEKRSSWEGLGIFEYHCDYGPEVSSVFKIKCQKWVPSNDLFVHLVIILL